MYLGIDYGRKRIGLAVGSQFPRGIGVFKNPGSFDKIIGRLMIVCRDYDVDKIVVGLPGGQQGEKSDLVIEIEAFAEAVKNKIFLPVVFEAEDYSSVAAESELSQRGVSVRQNKEMVDELAAVIILEQYINSKR